MFLIYVFKSLGAGEEKRKQQRPYVVCRPQYFLPTLLHKMFTNPALNCDWYASRCKGTHYL